MRKKVGPKDIIGKREGLRITEPEKTKMRTNKMAAAL